MSLKRSLGLLALYLLLISSRGAAAGIDLVIRHSILQDGVEKWEISAEGTNKPVFFAMYDSLTNQTLSSEGQPFGRSVAFLVGIGKYDYLTPLPGVEQDLRRVREYLLYRGGFDEVYQVRDQVATVELIDYYMTKFFPKTLETYDRLFFYYSGHGANQVKDFSVLQMADAKPGDFKVGKNLDTKDVVKWSRLLKANCHALFLLDNCSASVDFTARGDLSFANDSKTLREAAGESSRIVMSASSERELTFGDTEGGYFTQAMIDVLEKPQTGDLDTGYLTLNEVFAKVQRAVIQKGTELGIGMSPNLVPLLTEQYKGQFLFLRPQQARAVQRNSRKGKVSIQVVPWGDVRILPLDEALENPRLFELPTGSYEARIVNGPLDMELVKVFIVQADHTTVIHAKFPVQVGQLLHEHGLTDTSRLPEP
jgi:hypothetical protein